MVCEKGFVFSTQPALSLWTQTVCMDYNWVCPFKLLLPLVKSTLEQVCLCRHTRRPHDVWGRAGPKRERGRETEVWEIEVGCVGVVWAPGCWRCRQRRRNRVILSQSDVSSSVPTPSSGRRSLKHGGIYNWFIYQLCQEQSTSSLQVISIDCTVFDLERLRHCCTMIRSQWTTLLLRCHFLWLGAQRNAKRIVLFSRRVFIKGY